MAIKLLVVSTPSGGGDSISNFENCSKLGLFAERLVSELCRFERIVFPEDTKQVDKICRLSRADLLPGSIYDILTAFPELPAAFVMPNHPEIIKLNGRAAQFLEKWTGAPSFGAYQSGDPNRVLLQAAAVYGALQEQNIIYSVPPASFQRFGQRVRLCDAVLQHQYEKNRSAPDLRPFAERIPEHAGPADPEGQLTALAAEQIGLEDGARSGACPGRRVERPWMEYPARLDDGLMGYSRLGSVVTELFQKAILFAKRQGRIELAPNGNWIVKQAKRET